MKKIKINFDKHKAQQLVEFLLVAPFFVIILGIVTEYAYALSINMTLSQGLKTVTSELYSEISPNMTQSSIKDLVQTNLTNYLSSNNAPVREENNLQVSYAIAGDNAVFIASYKYISAFTLPNVYFHFLPDSFNFSSVSSVPAAFLKPSVYASIDSTTLDKIWASTADFSSLDSFNDAKQGIMRNSADSANSQTNSIVFLMPVTTPLGASAITYQVIPWQGTNTGTYIYLTDNHVYTCDTSSCSPTGFTNYLTYFESKGYKEIIFYSDNVPPDMTTLPTYWATSSGSLCDKSVDGILKSALALYNSTANIGNYDNIDLKSYNSEVTTLAANTGGYAVETIGSTVIIHKREKEDLTSAASGFSPSSVTYDFGSKVHKL